MHCARTGGGARNRAISDWTSANICRDIDFGHLNRHSPETEAVPKEGDSKTAADCLIGRVERLLVRRAIRPLPSVGPQPADCSVVSAGTH